MREKLSWPDNDGDVEAWRKQWSAAFTLRHREVINTSQTLAVKLADLASAIRRKVHTALEIETERGPLRKLMRAFQEALIHDLKNDDFADMYAQTIAYGLLTARVSRQSGGLVADDIPAMFPKTSPFLAELLETFLHLGGRRKAGRGAGLDFDELGINDVVEMLRAANMEAVLRDFDNRNPREDPVIHFYELFLKEYDAKKRMQRGVFYTPKPVVSYIVRSVHELLQTEFGLPDGLADTTTWGEMGARCPGLQLPTVRGRNAKTGIEEDQPIAPDTPFVQILDPATGTATFLVEVIDVIHRTLTERWKRERLSKSQQLDAWNQYVPCHLLPRLHGYELMMAPYAIAHMKLGLKLGETGYRFDSDERARIFLTNALEPPTDIEQLHFADWAPALAHEAQAVGEIKRNQRFTVVIGNPPYARISSNMGDWISNLIEDFKYVDGRHFGEVKHWLHDDYIKFMRLGYFLLEKTGRGIVGMITNRGYLSGPTFRGMRCFVTQKNFRLHILDLHGGALQEECDPPSGVADQNVFDIKQGVAISIAVDSPQPVSDVSQSYDEIWGTQEYKYESLETAKVTSAISRKLVSV